MAPQTPRVNPSTDALIVVDVQNDFLPGGALAVPEGDSVIPALNRWLAVPGLFKLASRDWHPPDHCSFKNQGGAWPVHCERDTPGAMFPDSLDVSAADRIVSKATEPDQEAYSVFDAPDLEPALAERGARRLWIGGLATEYCVLATVLDASEAGYEVFVIEDAIRGIDVNPGDCEGAIQQMREAGAAMVKTDDALGS